MDHKQANDAYTATERWMHSTHAMGCEGPHDG